MRTENRNKRVVFTMGGKGGVGKTGLMVGRVVRDARLRCSTSIPRTKLADR